MNVLLKKIVEKVEYKKDFPNYFKGLSWRDVVFTDEFIQHLHDYLIENGEYMEYLKKKITIKYPSNYKPNTNTVMEAIIDMRYWDDFLFYLANEPNEALGLIYDILFLEGENLLWHKAYGWSR